MGEPFRGLRRSYGTPDIDVSLFFSSLARADALRTIGASGREQTVPAASRNMHINLEQPLAALWVICHPLAPSRAAMTNGT